MITFPDFFCIDFQHGLVKFGMPFNVRPWSR